MNPGSSRAIYHGSVHDPQVLDPYLLAVKASVPEVDIHFWRHATSQQRGRAIAFLMDFAEAMVALRGWRDPPEDLPTGWLPRPGSPRAVEK